MLNKTCFPKNHLLSVFLAYTSRQAGTPGGQCSKACAKKFGIGFIFSERVRCFLPQGQWLGTWNILDTVGLAEGEIQWRNHAARPPVTWKCFPHPVHVSGLLGGSDEQKGGREWLG